MRRNNPLEQLKRLKDIPVSPETLDHGRVKLQAFMAAHPLAHVTSLPWWRNAFVWKPAAAFAMMSVAVGGSAMTVSASGNSLPGDSLYHVKLLAEQVHTKLAFSAEAQFRAQAQQAERRLDEADVVLHLTTSATETRQEQLKLTMQRYQNHVAVLSILANKLSDNDNTDGHGRSALSASVAAHEVEAVLAHHESLVESASNSSDVDDDLVSNAKPTLELEAKVMKAFGIRATRANTAHAHAEVLRKRLEKIQERADTSHDANGEIIESSDETHAHEHVDADAPAVVIPVVNQARIQLRNGIRARLETNINVDNASTR